MPIDSARGARRSRPSAANLPTSPDRPASPVSPPASEPAPPRSSGAVDAPKPLESVTARVPGDLAEQWKARYRELAVPSQVFMAVAMRMLLEQDDAEVSRRAAEESFRQAQDKARRRLARP